MRATKTGRLAGDMPEPGRDDGEVNGRRRAKGLLVALYAVSVVSLALAPLLMPEGYSWISNTTSESAAQGIAGAWVARLGFLAFGFAVLGSVAVSAWWGLGARCAHAGFGVCMIGAAAFSTRYPDPSMPYVEVEDLIHSVAATVMGFFFAAGVAMVAYRWIRAEGRVRIVDVVALIASVAVPVAMSSWSDGAGLLQRIMFAVAYVWYVLSTVGRRVPVDV